MIVVECQCGKRFSVPDELAGRTGRCTACGWRVVVPLSMSSPEARAAVETATLMASSSQLEAIGQESSGELRAVREPDKLPPSEALVDREVAGYLVGRRLGEKRSSVFHAATPDRAGEVAIKVMRRERIDRNPAAGERFMRETRALGELSHPNLVKLIASGEEEGSFWIAMELHPGITLEKRLNMTDHGRLPEKDVMPIIADVARGLDHLHAAGLVHRAIRPVHVLVNPTQLCGFGLVRGGGGESAPPGKYPDVTAFGQIVGKAAYMSPDQIEGVDVDGQSDLFSLGVTAYRALVGETPFAGLSPIQTVRTILTTEAPRVTEKAPEVSEKTADIIARLMERDRARRYASAKDLLADLEK